MQTTPKQTEEGIVLYLLLLTFFLVLLEISYFIQCNGIYLSDFTFVSKNLNIPVTIVPGILYFLLSQFLVHLFYILSVWCIIELIAKLIPVAAKQKISFSISIWILGMVTIFTANQYLIPNSKFSELTSLILINPGTTKLAFIILTSCCSLVILLSLISLMNEIIHSKILFFFLLLICAISAIAIYCKQEFSSYHSLTDKSNASSSRPNILLIGVDSLRPDFLSYFGRDQSTPFFDSFLEQSSVFSEAVTPLARTFPSWSSILTGQYPRQIKIRSNLANHDNQHIVNTLPAILQRHGYETIYATDETRFSNIDKYFGFDHIVSPPMGLNDFLIGNFNDFPLSNLLINTKVGKWLFPHSYANRPVYFAYDPDSFLTLLTPIIERKHQQPLFFAVHFCLTHAPYIWKNLNGNDLTPQERYAQSIGRVDQQISDFFLLLKKNHLLDHAIVILLSDHGEALEFPGDRITEQDLYISSHSSETVTMPKFYPPSLDDEQINQSAGHGTDVLGLPQYHTLLAFQLYGVGPFKAGPTTGVVSLLDIKPTILELLNIPAPDSSGISLSKYIQGQSQDYHLNSRHIFLESDFSSEAIRTVYPDERKVLLEGIELFQINPLTTRLTVKDEMTVKIIHSKQYADIYDGWMLALYPQNQNVRMPILVNLNTGQWTNELQSPFALHSPAQLMLEKLRAFYGSEISSVSTS